MQELLKLGISETESNLGSEATHSGSTCCSWVIYDNKLICANVGDSRAIIISQRTKEELKNFNSSFVVSSSAKSSLLK